MKFIGHTISYGVFIVLIIVSSLLFTSEFNKPLKRLSDQYPNISAALRNASQYKSMNNLTDCLIYPNDDLYFRFDRPTSIDIIISVFVIGKRSIWKSSSLINAFFFLGFFWHELKQAYNDGLRDYLLSWNNIVDSCMNILYISSFALKYYVIIRVSFNWDLTRRSRKLKIILVELFRFVIIVDRHLLLQVIYGANQLREPQFQENLEHLCELNEAKQWRIYQTFYWLNAGETKTELLIFGVINFSSED